MKNAMNYEQLKPETCWPLSTANKTVERNFAGEPVVYLGTYVEPVRNGLRAIVTVDLMDGWQAGHWLHLSISRADRVPTWAELVRARDALGYKEWLFIQMLAPASAWLNVHDYCMHLYHRLDQETVPRVLWDQEGATGARYGEHG